MEQILSRDVLIGNCTSVPHCSVVKFKLGARVL